jgi:hypothetical protein
MKLVKVTVTLLVDDQEGQGAEAMEEAYDKGRLDVDDLRETAESEEVTFQDA